MPSTYSNIKIQLMATGENNTTWGNVTNINLGTAIEEAIVGSADVTFASANVTLTLTDTNASQTARHMRLRCTGVTGGSTRNLVVPAIEKPYIVQNDCSDSILVKTAAGNGITVPAGKTMWVYSDGTNVVNTTTHLSSLTLGTDLAVADGGTGASTFTANGVLLGNGTSALSATAVGATGQVLVGNTGAAPSWAALSGIGVTSLSFGSTGLTPATATTGAITVAGTLGVANGGTGATTLSSGYLVKGNGTSAVSASVVYDNGTNVGIGTASPASKLNVVGTTTITDGLLDLSTGYSIRWGGAASGIYSGSGVEDMVFTVGSSERMRVNGSSGNVGIGTATPADRLTVIGGAMRVENTFGYGATMLNTSGMGMYMTYADQGNSSAVGTNNGSLIFYNATNTTERMRINGVGNVGIGTTSPAVRLDVRGIAQFFSGASGSFNFIDVGRTTSEARMAVAAATNDFVSGTAAGDAVFYNPTAANAWFGVAGAGAAVFVTNSAERMRILSGGDVGIGTSSPTARLHVNSGASTTAAIIESTGTSSFVGLRNSGGTAFVGSDSTGALLIQTPGSGFTTKVYVSSTGSVGVNTSSPASLFQVFAGQATITSPTASATSFALREDGLYFTRNDLPGIWRNKISNSWSGTPSNTTMNFELATGASTNNTVMSLFADGNVGIGTATPTVKLDVNGSIGVQAVGSAVLFDTTGAAQANYISTVDNFSLRMICGRGVTASFTAGPGAATIETNTVERMRVTAAGDVGIGTTIPASTLAVNTASGVAPANTSGANALRLTSTATAAVGVGPSILFEGQTGNTTANYGFAGIQGFKEVATLNNYGGVLAFYTQGGGGASALTEHMRINNLGQVGIGTTAPIGRLQVSGAAGALLVDFSGSNYYDAAVHYFRNYAATATSYISVTPTETLFTTNTTLPLTFGTNNTERMRIAAGGNVGIGTTSPITQLDVRSSTDTPVVFQSTAANSYIRFINSVDGNGYIGLSSAALTFWTSSERMRIDGSGNVGIGTTSPGAKLSVLGGALSSVTDLALNISSPLTTGRMGTYDTNTVSAIHTVFDSTSVELSAGSTSGWVSGISVTGNNAVNYKGTIRFATASAERMRIDSVGNVGIGTSTPSTKLDVNGTSNFSDNMTLSRTNTAGSLTGISITNAGTTSAYAGFTVTSGSVISQFFNDANGSAIVAGAMLRTVSAHPLVFGTDTTEKMRITSAGDVGIGTTTPGARLSVNGGNFYITNSGSYTEPAVVAGVIAFDSTNGDLNISARSNGGNTFTRFFTSSGGAGSERARIDSSGNLLVGATSIPTTTGWTAQMYNGGSYTRTAHNTNAVSGDAFSQFYYNSASIGSIDQNGTTGVLYTTASDGRLKHDIIDAPEVSSLIDAIQVRSFKWNADNSEQRYGMIAQELQEVVPEAVNQPADPDEMMGVDYSKLVPLLLKEIQSLRARVAQLEERK